MSAHRSRRDVSYMIGVLERRRAWCQAMLDTEAGSPQALALYVGEVEALDWALELARAYQEWAKAERRRNIERYGVGDIPDAAPL